MRDQEWLYPQLHDNCVSAWCPSQSGNTGLQLRDLSGRQNHSTLVNMDRETDWVKSGEKLALDFDGSNDYALLAQTVSLSEFMLSTWYRTSNAAQTAGIIFGDAAGGVGSGNKIGMVGSKFYVRSGGTGNNTVTIPTDGLWHHIAFTRDIANSWNIYLDGVVSLLGTGPGSSAYALNVIAANGSDKSQPYFGLLDDIRVYNKHRPVVIQLLSRRRGIAFETARRKSYAGVAGGTSFKAAWASRRSQIIGGGLR